MSLSSERLQYRWMFMRIMEICAMFHVSPENRSFVLISLHMVCIWFDLSYTPAKCIYAPPNRSEHSNRKLIVIRRYTKFIPTISVVRYGIFRCCFDMEPMLLWSNIYWIGWYLVCEMDFDPQSWDSFPFPMSRTIFTKWCWTVWSNKAFDSHQRIFPSEKAIKMCIFFVPVERAQSHQTQIHIYLILASIWHHF